MENEIGSAWLVWLVDTRIPNAASGTLRIAQESTTLRCTDEPTLHCRHGRLR